MEKIKLLGLFDYGCSTGFGQVASNILTRLQATGRYDITVVGINYDPKNEISPERWPGRIIPAVTISDLGPNGVDVYGRQTLLNELGRGIYDIFFTIQDTFVIQTIADQIVETRNALSKKFATVMYYPIDAEPKKEWITDCVAKMDFPVPYTNYAREETLKVAAVPQLCDPIYHGTNLKDFHYIEDREKVKEFRHKFFQGEADSRFLITNVNRNQPRKDVVRNFMILEELKKRGRNPLMYLHMSHNDSGGNLMVMAEHFGFKLKEDFILPSPRVFSVNQGMSIEAINNIYNASDALLSTTLGEGWGLSITEAMATRLPIVCPDNTSLREMCADHRAFLVPSGADPSHWFNLGGPDNERMRPLMDVEEAADKLEDIMDGKLPDIDGAQKWAEAHNWDKIHEEWQAVFDEAYEYAQSLNGPKLNREQRRKLKKQKVAV